MRDLNVFQIFQVLWPLICIFMLMFTIGGFISESPLGSKLFYINVGMIISCGVLLTEIHYKDKASGK